MKKLRLIALAAVLLATGSAIANANQSSTGSWESWGWAKPNNAGDRCIYGMFNYGAVCSTTGWGFLCTAMWGDAYLTEDGCYNQDPAELMYFEFT